MDVQQNLKYIDSHCHLDFPEFEHNLKDEIQEAYTNGVSGFVVPGVTCVSWPRIARIAKKYDEIFPAFGLHPFFMQEHKPKHIELLGNLLSEGSAIAVGEFGLDYQLDSYDISAQQYYFNAQMELAKQFKLPVILHVRKAHDDVIKYLKTNRFKYGGIVHAFSGSLPQALMYIRLGFKLGFGGASTYERAKKQHTLIKELPLRSIVLETDAPDMPPSFVHRGQINSPKYLPMIAHHVAKVRGIDVAELADAVLHNTISVFGLNGTR